MRPAAEAPGGEVVLYEARDGDVRVGTRLDHETVRLTQEQVGQLFGRELSVVTKRVRNCFGRGNWSQRQLVQDLHKFKPRAKEPSPARSSTTTERTNYPSASLCSRREAQPWPTRSIGPRD